MSRVGRAPIPVPVGVSIELQEGAIAVSGPKGSLTRTIPADMRIDEQNGELVVQRPSDEAHHRALHGLTRALLANMVTGVTAGYEKTLEIEGTGYRAEDDGGTLVLNVGYSHPVRMRPPAGITFAVEDRGKKVVVRGIDKELVGQVAVNIRQVRPPEPYKGKGIRYAGERIRRKAGKAGKVGR
jgi:large subunit ribosomal protein L6